MRSFRGVPTGSELVAPQPAASVVNPVEAAKRAWKAWALREAAFAERLFAGAADAIGTPMPPCDADG